MSFLKLFTRDRTSALQLLENSNDKETLVNEKNNGDWSCVHLVAVDGDYKSLRKLIENGVNMWTVNHSDLYPLHYAVACSHFKVVQLLLSNIKDYVTQWLGSQAIVSSHCPFKHAFRLKDYRIAKELIDKFLPRFTYDTVKNIVHEAMRECTFEFIKLAIVPNERANDVLINSSCVTQALGNCNFSPQLFDYLLEVGEVNYPYSFIRHVYFQFFRNLKNVEILKCFARYEHKITDLCIPNVLIYAILSDYSEFVDVALALGCDPYEKHDYEKPCMYYAIEMCQKYESEKYHIALRKMLLYQGFTPSKERICFTGYTTETLELYIEYACDLINEYYRNVSLFEILAYRHHIQELKSEFKNLQNREL